VLSALPAKAFSPSTKALGAPGKGVLAIDESSPTIAKRFAAINVESTPETNNTYRDILLTTEGLSDFISGVILFDETLRQSTIADATPFPNHLSDAGILPGIKVDKGAKPLAGHEGEKVAEGLEGLRDRLTEYAELGAKFAKWRAVIVIDGDSKPSRAAVDVNAHGLARYAALAQEAGLVPICEPEVLMDGEHTIERSLEVTEKVVSGMYTAFKKQGVLLEGTVLKVNMVLSGYEAETQASDNEVAEATLRCLKRCVPAAVPSVLFLSGGQTEQEAARRLNLMNQIKDATVPWNLSFSFGRALQHSALRKWNGQSENAEAAQAMLLQRSRLAGAATLGTYSEGPCGSGLNDVLAFRGKRVGGR
jgi:fructose-bisphosphate aldolase class I